MIPETLSIESEEFGINNHLKKYKLSGERDVDCFLAGARSKFVEKQKIEFAIEQLHSLKQRYESLAIYRGTIKEYIDLQIEELENLI